MLVIFFLMVRLPTKTTRTYTLFPYTTLFRSPDYRIARSPKSYNSQIGVALSLWQMNDTHQLAIIEAGVSRTGEMEALHRMIQPRSEEHTSELQSLMRMSYAAFCSTTQTSNYKKHLRAEHK